MTDAPKQIAAGIHDGVSMNDYLHMRGFSASKAHILLRYSPFHAWRGIRGEPSDVADAGTSIHSALLEGIDLIDVIDPEQYRSKPTKAHPDGNIPDGWTNIAIRAARDASRASGRIPMLAADVQQIKDAVTAAQEHIYKSPLRGIFERGKPEQTIVWEEWFHTGSVSKGDDADGAITCKARPDFLTDERDVLIHVKTTKGSAEPEAFGRGMLVQMGYDVAAAFYARGLDYVNDERKALQAEHVFLVIEQNPPHGCSLVGLKPQLWDIARGKVDRAIRTWQKCRASNQYPGYPVGITYAEPRNWQLEEALENGDIESLSFEERIELGSQA